MNSYRIEDKQNIFQGGYNKKHQKTLFKFFERRGDAFFYAGTFTANGWDCGDTACANSARETIEEDDQP